MKKTVLTILFSLLTLHLFANENQTGSRDILSLSYFPNAGKVFISPSVKFDSTSYSMYMSNLKVEDYDKESVNTGLTAGCGITDDFAFSLSGSYYLKDSSKTTEYDGTKTTEKSKGFADPELTIGYRAYEDAFICDLFAAYSPELVEAKSGTEGKGGQSAGLKLNLGKNINQSEISLEIGYLYYSALEQNNEDGSKTKTAGSNNFIAGLSFQQKFDNLALMIGAGYSHNFNSNTTIKNDRYMLSAGLKYAFIPQQLLIAADYSYSIYADYSKSFSDYDEGTGYYTFYDVSLRDMKESAFNVSAMIQF